ncbi:MAG TPA: hypothetical protein VMC06_08945 [Opitutaceae bacterium]|nr:hypothetical protein [Opitutaceae bacterium]
MSSEKPLVYLFLGIAGSGRREVVANLIADGLAPEDRAATLLAEGEAACASDARLDSPARWHWTPDHKIEAALPAGATHVFFVTDGRRNPVDQVEAFKVWLDASGAELGSILCVVHCQLAEKHHTLLAWYDACVHFSDIVLLNRRDGVANKWMSDLQGRYKAQFLPCLLEFVKNGHVKNPVLILEPQARRISQVFDPAEDLGLAEGIEIHDETEDDSDETAAEGGEAEDAPQEDPYFARKPGGRRVKEIPDLAKFLGTAESTAAQP